ncbi:hypothetical protein [Streptomyces avermitilis]|uniref:hypothetical protein n=1 Tax=Streptomyces avermitilis TaxID=33903 RepID=UPI00339F6EF8
MDDQPRTAGSGLSYGGATGWSTGGGHEYQNAEMTAHVVGAQDGADRDSVGIESGDDGRWAVNVDEVANAPREIVLKRGAWIVTQRQGKHTSLE